MDNDNEYEDKYCDEIAKTFATPRSRTICRILAPILQDMLQKQGLSVTEWQAMDALYSYGTCILVENSLQRLRDFVYVREKEKNIQCNKKYDDLLWHCNM